jgi:hypothetical protein
MVRLWPLMKTVAFGGSFVPSIHGKYIVTRCARTVTFPKMCIDCTCVDSNIHHPTDSTLLRDAVWVLPRLEVKKVFSSSRRAKNQ